MPDNRPQRPRQYIDFSTASFDAINTTWSPVSFEVSMDFTTAPERSPALRSFDLTALTDLLDNAARAIPGASLEVSRSYFYAIDQEADMALLNVEFPRDMTEAQYREHWARLRELIARVITLPILDEAGNVINSWGPLHLHMHVGRTATFTPVDEDEYAAYSIIRVGLVASPSTPVSVGRYYSELDECGRCSMLTPLVNDNDVCTECGVSCSECGELFDADTTGGSRCSRCEAIYAYCGSCGDPIESEMDVYNRDGDAYCRYCAENYDEEFGDEDPLSSYSRGRPSNAEEFDPNLQPVSFLLEDVPGRVNRRIGLEIEGGGNGGVLANALYEVEASHENHSVGYHAQTRNGGNRFTVESDATVDWEMVSPVLDLRETGDADLAQRAISTLWNLSQGNELWHDYRAGLHIHVGAEHISIAQAYRLGHLWNFVENAVFRLSAAKWGHHRIHEQGTSFCQPLPKGFKNRLEFSRTINRAGRYAALSFQNYLSGHMSNCSCGAVQFDSWDVCECESLGKCTFEFRVFNATSNPLKLKAYIGLVQALVNYAIEMDPLTDEEWEARFPAQGYTDSDHTPYSESQSQGLLDALRFIFTDLVLSEAERDALAYCVEESDLASLGATFIPVTNRQEVLV